jgi:hypothetical protein
MLWMLINKPASADQWGNNLMPMNSWIAAGYTLLFKKPEISNPDFRLLHKDSFKKNQ